MLSTCSKRLMKEKQQLEGNNDETIELVCSEDQLRCWFATIRGPPGSFYEDRSFRLSIDVPIEYPMTPPTIRFKTKIFHPNVKFETGEICLNILKSEAWSPAWSLHSACRAIVALLEAPAADSPLNCDAGNILRAGDTRAFRSMVNMYCEEYCCRS